MNSICWLKADEYETVSPSSEWPQYKQFITEFLGKPDEANAEEYPKRKDLLGLHWRETAPYASCFVGQVWLKPAEKIAFRVRPRQDVDHFAMVSKCLEIPIVAHYLLKNCLYLRAEDHPLPMEREQTSFPLLLLISQYLSELSLLCRRHLKRGFPRIEENLIGRCKGRVHIKQNILHNSAKGRIDRLFCQFQTHSLDTPENQILKAALEQSLRFLRRHARGHTLQPLWQWATESIAFFSEVSLRRIHPGDFQRVRYAGVMKPYKKPHTLARIILRALGTDPNNPPSEKTQVLLPPYSIDMNELFERYCEVLLRKEYKDELWAGYGFKDGKGFSIHHGEKIRPDFFLSGKKWILDAKNKYGDKKHWLREDIAQVCLYVRHKNIRKMMNLSDNQEEPQVLVLMYPDPNQPLSETTITNFRNQLAGFNPMSQSKYFHQVYKILVPVPK